MCVRYEINLVSGAVHCAEAAAAAAISTRYLIAEFLVL